MIGRCRTHSGNGLVVAAGERRHVTLMFCDLVDSTGIASKLDAEEWRDLVGKYLNTAIDLEVLREPQASRTERRLAVGSRAIEHGRCPGA
jgi:class 3 adenylate cyclase